MEKLDATSSHSPLPQGNYLCTVTRKTMYVHTYVHINIYMYIMHIYIYIIHTLAVLLLVFIGFHEVETYLQKRQGLETY